MRRIAAQVTLEHENLMALLYKAIEQTFKPQNDKDPNQLMSMDELRS